MTCSGADEPDRATLALVEGEVSAKAWLPITPHDAVRVLNEALALDRAAVSELFLRHRVTCNEELGNHPSIQVRPFGGGAGGAEVGPLGIIEGLFGADGIEHGPIVAVVEGDADDHGSTITRFDVREYRAMRAAVEAVESEVSE